MKNLSYFSFTSSLPLIGCLFFISSALAIPLGDDEKTGVGAKPPSSFSPSSLTLPGSATPADSSVPGQPQPQRPSPLVVDTSAHAAISSPVSGAVASALPTLPDLLTPGGQHGLFHNASPLAAASGAQPLTPCCTCFWCSCFCFSCCHYAYVCNCEDDESGSVGLTSPLATGRGQTPQAPLAVSPAMTGRES